MSALNTLQEGIKALGEEMSTATDKDSADEIYAEKLAQLIDDHVKSHIAELTATAVAGLGLVAGPYPVTLTSPAISNLEIKE